MKKLILALGLLFTICANSIAQIPFLADPLALQYILDSGAQERMQQTAKEEKEKAAQPRKSQAAKAVEAQPAIQLPDLPNSNADRPKSVNPTRSKVGYKTDVEPGYAQNGKTTVEPGYVQNAAQPSPTFKSFATSKAATTASTAVQDWLGQLGSAKVDFGGGDGFRTAAVDLLVKLHDTKTDLVFSQIGVRRTNNLTPSYRTTVNIGGGYRHFFDEWMIGGNGFYDMDTTVGHRRIGIGAEAWADYLKLSANAYLQSSGWKESPDVKDYNERPANGWDVRAEGYLPSYPQLGGKLMFEQYYGNEVGLFGATNRQSNPSALTLGVSYTPIPMLTLAVDHRRGQGGMHDSKFKLKFEYAIGVPLKEQLAFTNLAEFRKLKYSRYDLVERNNQIVLEYRKKDMGQIKLPDTVSGYPLTSMSFPVTIASALAVRSVEFQGTGSPLVASVAVPTAMLDLPAYDAASTNTYLIQAVATDSSGRLMRSNWMQVTVAPLALTVARSKAEASADGTDAITFTAKLVGKNAEPMANRKIAWTVRNAVLKSSTDTTDALGQAVAVVTSATSTLAEVDAVESSTNSKVTTDAAFIGDPTTARVVTFVAAPPVIAATAATTSTLTATIKDAAGNAVGAGVPVNWTTSLGTLAAASTTTDSTGTAKVVLTSATTTGTANLTAKGVAADPGKTASVIFAADNATARVVAFTATPTSIAANGATTSTLSATVKDANGNTVGAGVPVNWTTSLGTLASAATTTNASGVATVVLTSSTTAGIANMSAKGATGDPGRTATVTFVPDTSTAQVVSFTAAPSPVLANGAAPVALTALVKDAHGNTVGAGVSVTWTASIGNLGAASSVTDSSGVATVNLTSTVAGTSNLTAKAAAGDGGKTTTAVFTSDASTARVVTFAASPTTIVANGSTTSTLTATIKDTFGNSLGAGLPVYWSTSLGNVASASTLTDSTGTAVVTLTSGTAAGTANLTAKGAAGDAGRTATVNFVADLSTAMVVNVAASPSSIPGNGTSTSTLTATVADANGNAVGAGVTVTWSTSAGNLASATTTTTAGSTTTVVLTSSAMIGTANVNARGVASDAGKTTPVAFVADPATARVVSFSAAPSPVLADGVSAVTLTATVKDSAGNALGAGVPINWTTSLGSLAAASTSTDSTGTATVTLTSTTAATANLTAKGAGSDIGKTASASFVADPSTAIVSLINSAKTTMPGTGSSTSTLTARVVDAFGNALNAFSVAWTSTIGTLTSANSTTDATGNASNTLTSPTVVSDSAATIKAQIANGSNRSTGVTMTGPTVTAISASPTAIIANNSTSSTISASFAYSDGTAYNGSVQFTTSALGTFENGSSVVSKTSSAGGASASFKSATVGSTTIAANILANGSQRTTGVTVNAACESRFNELPSNFVQLEDGNGYGVVYWDNSYLSTQFGFFVGNSVGRSLSHGGYTYTIGAFQYSSYDNDTSYSYYTVIRCPN